MAELEVQNAKLKADLGRERMVVRELRSAGAGAREEQDGDVVENGSRPRAWSSGTTPPSSLSRARERVEQAKLRLQGHAATMLPADRHDQRDVTPQGSSSAGQGARAPVERSVSAGPTGAVFRAAGTRTESSQVSAADKLRSLQKKRQEQRLKAVRNWNDKDSGGHVM